MKIISLILILGFFSCTTLKKAEGYFEKHPEKAYYVAKQYINAFELPGAKICLDAFPPINKIDTFSVVKDSLTVHNITDTLYKWFTETKYINKDKIKKILVPCNDSIKIVSKIIYDEKYKILYNDLNTRFINISDSHSKIKRILFWTWFFIIIIAASAVLLKKK